MLKTLVLLPDGRELFSGGAGAAIEQFTLTQSVNSGQELTLGSVCAAMVELTVLSPGELQLQAGEELTVYRCLGDRRYKVGIFITEKPVRSSVNRLKITAYDRVSLLDRDLTVWLENLTGWPYTLQELSRMVCSQCGVALKDTPLPNGSWTVPKFRAGQLTGRQLLHWVGELCGRFCRADAEGSLEFAWYTPKDYTITPDGSHYYLGGSLHYSQYQAAPIEKVQLRRSEEDVGTVYPDIPAAVNTYTITGNPLLSADSAASCIGIAQTLYEQLHAVTYTPCQVAVAADMSLAAGDILTVQSTDGTALCLYVMTRTQKGSRDTLEATGSALRESSSAVNQNSIQSLSGKVLNLKTTVDGLQAENRDAAGKAASLSLEVAGLAAQVSRQQSDGQAVKTQLTALTQKADSVALRVEKIAQEGTSRVQTQTGFTFDERGLTISRDSGQVENLLDETGMYVRCQGNVILQASRDGVQAVDVSVQNYLVVGGHARLEDYSSGTDEKRTACYWI